MARLNQTVRRNPARRMQSERRLSIELLGADVDALMAELGVGERRAMAEAERRLGLLWHNGSFGKCAGHYLTQSTSDFVFYGGPGDWSAISRDVQGFGKTKEEAIGDALQQRRDRRDEKLIEGIRYVVPDEQGENQSDHCPRAHAD